MWPLHYLKVNNEYGNKNHCDIFKHVKIPEMDLPTRSEPCKWKDSYAANVSTILVIVEPYEQTHGYCYVIAKLRFTVVHFHQYQFHSSTLKTFSKTKSSNQKYFLLETELSLKNAKAKFVFIFVQLFC